MTEPSYDADLDAQYEDTVIFAKVEDMCETVAALLADEEVLLQLEHRSRLKYQEVSGNVHNFSLAINQALNTAIKK